MQAKLIDINKKHKTTLYLSIKENKSSKLSSKNFKEIF